MTTTTGYEVHLEIFEGPLDLLLFLIKKNDLDIYDIPISEITKEYLAYLDIIKDLNLETAGDFLIMASTLMQIKARTLLPSQETAGEEQGPDPREELVNRLLEYQKYKEAARFLDTRADEFKDLFYRGAPHFSEEEKSLHIDIFEMMAVMREMLEKAEDGHLVVKGEEFPVEDQMRRIMLLLERKPYVLLRDIFQDQSKRRAIISCFLAMLELIKLQRVFARQEAPYGDILIYKKEKPLPVIMPSGVN